MDINEYPMGPSLRKYLEIDSDFYTGDQAQPPNESQMAHFSDLMVERFSVKPVMIFDDFVDLLEEFVGMRLPSAGLALFESHSHFNSDLDFRAQLSVGNLAMLAGQLTLAESFFIRANSLNPSEPAPFINLAQVFFALEKDSAAKTWVEAGLEVDPNNQSLWEYLAGIMAQESRENIGSDLMVLAKERDSWAGVSLAAQILAPEDPMFRAEALGDMYRDGHKDEAFLCEYTASLGITTQYDKIISLVWATEKLQSEKKLHWQLYAHAAQAHLGLNEKKQAKLLLTRVLNDPDLPYAARTDFLGYMSELENS